MNAKKRRKAKVLSFKYSPVGTIKIADNRTIRFPALFFL